MKVLDASHFSQEFLRWTVCFLQTALHRSAPALTASFHLRFSVLLLFAVLAILMGPGVVVWGKAFLDRWELRGVHEEDWMLGAENFLHSNFTQLPPPMNTGALPSIAAFAFLAITNADLTLCRPSGSWRAAAVVAVVLAVFAPLFAVFSFQRLAWAIVTTLSGMGSTALVLKATRDSKRTKTDWLLFLIFSFIIC